MSIISFNEFIDRLNDFGDQMNLGLSHIGKGQFCYVNLYPINNSRYEFIEIQYTKEFHHSISYLDHNLLWIKKEFNDYSIPETLLDTIKEQYPKAAANYKSIPYRNRLKEIEKDFV